MGTWGMKFAVVLLVSQAISLTKPKEEYPAWMHGFGGYHQYMRDVPDRFEAEADDTLMRSMYQTYATEGKTEGWPNGHFWYTRRMPTVLPTKLFLLILDLIPLQLMLTSRMSSLNCGQDTMSTVRASSILTACLNSL